MYEIKYLFFQKRIIYISENTNNKNYRIFIRINIINCVCTYSHDIRVPLEYPIFKAQSLTNTQFIETYHDLLAQIRQFKKKFFLQKTLILTYLTKISSIL